MYALDATCPDEVEETVRRAAEEFGRLDGVVNLVGSILLRTAHRTSPAEWSDVLMTNLYSASAAATYARRGIRVNVVAPGLIRTPLSEPLTRSPASEQASVAMHPLGRLGEAEEVAGAISWLLDPEQSWVTGQVLGVDGGLGTVRAS